METLQDVEQAHIIRALQATKGNKCEAAKRLGISRGTLYRRLREYGLAKAIRGDYLAELPTSGNG